jgi:hypothetical protein
MVHNLIKGVMGVCLGPGVLAFSAPAVGEILSAIVERSRITRGSGQPLSRKRLGSTQLEKELIIKFGCHWRQSPWLKVSRLGQRTGESQPVPFQCGRRQDCVSD